ncbi:hypothetical protein GCM10009092_44090 [Bowmanella denitrificans]|uniref:Uncharacterized protein n=2 Tax=Bowmanella denitrificans TaxID=366582 RepID=A0ABN0XWM6_9ALTE
MKHRMPLLIGVSGHRNALLRDSSGNADESLIVQAIITALKHWRAQVGEQTPIWLLTGMASGPDLLAIDAVEALMEGEPDWYTGNCDVIPVLPMPVEYFRADFAGTEPAWQTKFDYYLNKYQHNLIVTTANMSDEERLSAYTDLNYGESRSQLYLNQGAFLSRYSNVLLTLWDGQDSDSVGGTADVVKLKCGMPGVCTDKVHPGLQPVGYFDGLQGGVLQHILVERTAENPAEHLTAGFQRLAPDAPEQATVYLCHSHPSAQTSPLSSSLSEEFVALVRQLKQFNAEPMQGDCSDDALLGEGLAGRCAIFSKADKVALKAQSRYRTQLLLFMAFAFLGLLAYETVSNLLNTLGGLIIIGAVLVVVGVTFFIILGAKMARLKWRYQLNRMVAESLRLRGYLNLADVPPSLPPMLPRRYRSSFPLVSQANALGEMIWWQDRQTFQNGYQGNLERVKEQWIGGQIRYLDSKLKTTRESKIRWINKQPKLAMQTFNRMSYQLFIAAVMLGVMMWLVHGWLLWQYPLDTFAGNVNRCELNQLSNGFLPWLWCEWDTGVMLAVQFLVMLGGVIALWVELANYRFASAGFAHMQVFYKRAQFLLAQSLTKVQTDKLLTELANEAMQEHAEWNLSEAESDLARR